MALHIEYSDATTMNQQLMTDRVGRSPQIKTTTGPVRTSSLHQIIEPQKSRLSRRISGEATTTASIPALIGLLTAIIARTPDDALWQEAARLTSTTQSFLSYRSLSPLTEPNCQTESKVSHLHLRTRVKPDSLFSLLSGQAAAIRARTSSSMHIRAHMLRIVA